MSGGADIELVYGSGNAFWDFGYATADLHQAKSLLASAIIKILDQRGWTTLKAQEATGISRADFSRIRRAHLGRFTLDRLVAVLSALGQDVELSASVGGRQSAV